MWVDVRSPQAICVSNEENCIDGMLDKFERQDQAIEWLTTLFSRIASDDSGLSGHCSRVSSLAMQLTRSLPKADTELLDVMACASQIHDIGKLAIPRFILDKPGQLADEEVEIMRRHAAIGASLLTSFGEEPSVTEVVHHHHEWWDGTGYPDGFAGEAIPLGARIIAICDAFDAMTSDRPYRGARSASEALRELERCAGTQFDPQLVEHAIEQFGS